MGLRYLIFALLTAIGLGIFAQNKHKSVIGWVLFGLFLPPIAIIVALLRFCTGGWDELSLTERRCPHCLSVIDIRATKCKNCAGDLPLVLLPKREDGSIDCPKCRGSNVRLASGGYYCDDCSKVVAQPTHFGPRIEEEEITRRLTTQSVSPPKPISAEEIYVDEEVLDLTPDIVKPPTSKEKTKKEETIIDPPPFEQTIIQEDTFKISVSVKRVEDPSLKAVFLTPLIYMFGSLAFVGVYVFTVAVYGVAFGISLEKHASFFTATAHFLSFLFFLIMTIFLVKRYSGYLFSGSWKINFYRHLKTGLKWSIPFIFLTGINVLIPETHAELTKTYLLEIRLSQENITIGNIIIFSAEILIATFLEELIFRGMIQQYIKKLVTPRISVLITAGIFTLAHFGKFFIHPVSLGNIGFWFIMGIFTGFAFNKANSCISSFIPHLVANFRFIIFVPLMLIF